MGTCNSRMASPDRPNNAEFRLEQAIFGGVFWTTSGFCSQSSDHTLSFFDPKGQMLRLLVVSGCEITVTMSNI